MWHHHSFSSLPWGNSNRRPYMLYEKQSLPLNDTLWGGLQYVSGAQVHAWYFVHAPEKHKYRINPAPGER